MKALLQDLLRRQPHLQMVALQSFSAPLELPTSSTEAAKDAPPAAVSFYRHGLRLTLQGGYFDLLDYLQAVQNSGWRLHWDSPTITSMRPGRTRRGSRWSCIP